MYTTVLNRFRYSSLNPEEAIEKEKQASMSTKNDHWEITDS